MAIGEFLMLDVIMFLGIPLEIGLLEILRTLGKLGVLRVFGIMLEAIGILGLLQSTYWPGCTNRRNRISPKSPKNGMVES